MASWYPGKFLKRIIGGLSFEERKISILPLGLHGLWEAIAGFGGLEDAVMRGDVEDAIRNVRSITRGVQIMEEEELISHTEAKDILGMLNEIASNIHNKDWNKAQTAMFMPNGLQDKLKTLLLRIAGI